jgi:Fe-S-cluster containining protein
MRRGLVRSKVERRRGECVRCGACCRLIFRCPALHYLPDGTAGCRYHQIRPMNCRVFPLDERDLAERDMVMPERRCGFYFEGQAVDAGAREAGS